jgi:glycosyltransferase involved in cell wall biosynthesis
MPVELRYPGRVALQQRVLPDYRAAFVEALARRCDGGLDVFAGEPRTGEGILPAPPLAAARLTRAGNLHLFSGRLLLVWQAGLIRWLEATQPQVLVLEANMRYMSSRLAVRWMRARRRPVVGWGLGAGASGGPGGILRRTWLNGFDALIAYSSLGAAQYRDLGFPAERVFVAPNVTAAAPERMPVRPAAAGRPRRLLFVGRLQPRKRVDLLLEACAALEPRPELTIVGDGPDAERLHGLAKARYPQARFLGDLRGAALDSAFEQADLFVLPGTGGLALQQALAAGLPIIAAEGDGSQQDMVTRDNGWRVRPGEGGELRQAVQRALALDEAALRGMGEASFQLARTRFSLEAMTTAFIEALCAVGLRRP